MCPQKNIPNIIDCHLKKGYLILVIFSTNISGTTGHQITIQYSIFFTRLPGENRTNEIWVEMNRNMSKSIPNIMDCNLKKNCQILIIFGANIFDTTCHKITVLVPTNVCFCTSWENPNRQNRIKMHHFVGFISPGSAKADNWCGRKLWTVVWSPVVSEILLSKTIKIW